ncbi:transmembrane protein, putative (macronuclear) [Tetrahymena thermophila SB210]|uniref:Transmembrane protein, putative n=1 Tax=Tetrahymena thermophila (strain SB210) TaxID=312017 RepID=W7XKJ4_TETTS|nr:transmembrane protein, putative [Tetrahymena thermophila SB210]EWS76586.1 transmembrane protein, putative [Tetrahymena thermophila SB210]|eukprot:XP_012650872.1 transmembrane protein, putative [Tetrahymena thermophila SB210]
MSKYFLVHQCFYISILNVLVRLVSILSFLYFTSIILVQNIIFLLLFLIKLILIQLGKNFFICDYRFRNILKQLYLILIHNKLFQLIDFQQFFYHIHQIQVIIQLFDAIIYDFFLPFYSSKWPKEILQVFNNTQTHVTSFFFQQFFKFFIRKRFILFQLFFFVLTLFNQVLRLVFHLTLFLTISHGNKFFLYNLAQNFYTALCLSVSLRRNSLLLIIIFMFQKQLLLRLCRDLGYIFNLIKVNLFCLFLDLYRRLYIYKRFQLSVLLMLYLFFLINFLINFKILSQLLVLTGIIITLSNTHFWLLKVINYFILMIHVFYLKIKSLVYN